MSSKADNQKQKTNPTKKIRKGDKVIAITGDDKGQSGVVLSIQGDKATVQGLNIVKKHVKRTQANPNGGILELEKPIHISNLRPCTPEGKPVKLRVRTNNEGHRELFYSNDGVDVLYRSLKKQ